MARTPLVVSYGMGVDSTAMLVGLHALRIRPDLKLARKHGYDVAPLIGRYRTAEVRREWPWSITAYTSRRKDGHGRVGSSLQGWLCRPIVCKLCHGTGRLFIDHTGINTKACRAKGCRGTGRIHNWNNSDAASVTPQT